jgi:hypothetical protein
VAHPQAATPPKPLSHIAPPVSNHKPYAIINIIHRVNIRDCQELSNGDEKKIEKRSLERDDIESNGNCRCNWTIPGHVPLSTQMMNYDAL